MGRVSLLAIAETQDLWMGADPPSVTFQRSPGRCRLWPDERPVFAAEGLA
jgi:hypothetical protein